METAVAIILTQIYELKFLQYSFGFRPGRNCHMAVKEVIEMVQYRKTNFVVEADIYSGPRCQDIFPTIYREH